MSNRRSRSKKSNRRVDAPPPSPSKDVFWPSILLRFADWLIENRWAEDQLTALSVAMAVDRSVRDRNVSVHGAELSIEVFCVDDYDYLDCEECEPRPWTHYGTRDAMAMFGTFVVSQGLSPSFVDEILAETGVLSVHRPTSTSPVAPGRVSSLSAPVVVSLLQQLAEWTVPGDRATPTRVGYWDDAGSIIAALKIPGFDGVGSEGDFMAMVNYRTVLETARRVGIFGGTAMEYTRGPDADAWLQPRTVDRERAAVVGAYASCLGPFVGPHGEASRSELTGAAALVTTVLARSLVGDPVRVAEGVIVGTLFDSKLIQLSATLRIMSMTDLGLLVKVNDNLCIPDILAPMLIEALSRDRSGRMSTAA